jgi:uncharacterized LabA/DUF88 family protein
MGIYGGHPPTLIDSIVFIDGKNLVCRFQEMAEEKSIRISNEYLTEKNIEYVKDKFVWSKAMNFTFPALGMKKFDVIRAYYYTFCNPQHYEELSKKISLTQIENRRALTLNPVILNGLNKQRNFKGDDIKICIDSIEHALNSNIQTFYFVTGDGDFLPLIEKIQKMGKYVFVTAFSKGLNENLKIKADFFHLLDSYFFNE